MTEVLGSVMTPASFQAPPTTGVPSILTPGDYLVELAFARPLRQGAETLERAMGAIGWSHVVVEESAKNDPVSLTEGWGEAGTNVAALFQDPPSLYRFFGRLERAIAPQDGPELAWIYARRSAIDVFSELSGSLRSPAGGEENENEAQKELFELVTDGDYELRFLARRKAQPTRESTLTDLRKMGFEPEKFMLLKRDMRLPGKPGASNALWYARAKWTKPSSYVSMEDSFYFEDVKPVE